MKAKLINGDEYDAFSAWRHVYNWKRGVLKRIKRRFWHRMRREGKIAIRRGTDE